MNPKKITMLIPVTKYSDKLKEYSDKGYEVIAYYNPDEETLSKMRNDNYYLDLIDLFIIKTEIDKFIKNRITVYYKNPQTDKLYGTNKDYILDPSEDRCESKYYDDDHKIQMGLRVQHGSPLRVEGLFSSRLRLLRIAYEISLSNKKSSNRLFLIADCGDEYISSEELYSMVYDQFIVDEVYYKLGFIKFNYKYKNKDKTQFDYMVKLNENPSEDFKFTSSVATMMFDGTTILEFYEGFERWVADKLMGSYGWYDVHTLPSLFSGEDMLLTMIIESYNNPNGYNQIYYDSRVIMEYDYNPKDKVFNQDKLMEDDTNLRLLFNLFIKRNATIHYNSFKRLIFRSSWFSFNDCERSDDILGMFSNGSITIKSWN